ncbi:hypothetical protein MNBD_ACTINO01-1324 [hydrothermal vent metagenome]|uniref:Uncharacterized protein n=1 Tax=hydrothermal vent metagenome TaxID=652676 RepID=A0A3B0SJP0_9ZZZZ
MRGDTIARAGMAVVFGGIALVLTVNADCTLLPERDCESLLGTAMPQVNRLHSVLWIAAAAAFGWFVFSTVNRAKILAATLLGGFAGFWVGVGGTVLYFELEARDRDPGVANANEGFLFIAAFFALVGLIAGLGVAFVLARRRWARRPTNPGTTGTGDPGIT